MKRLTAMLFCFGFIGRLCCFAEEAQVFHCDFESETWYEQWNLDRSPQHVTLVDSGEDPRFEPVAGKAIKIRIEPEGHYGTSFAYHFQEQTGAEPEEIYFRYYLRFADDWNPEQGGKLPGIAGTYNRAGWGGRPVHGDDGWSARGLFNGQKNGKTPIGFYCYHVDMKGKYGSNWVWDRDQLGYLVNNRWYCIEQYVRMNEPDRANGILRAWVDGKLAFEKTDTRFRTTGDLKIETVWINVYLGGTWTAKREHHLYIDEVAISRHPIGPLTK